jgi:hypothetical protein
VFDSINRCAKWFELAALMLAPAGALTATAAAELPRAERLATPPVRTLVGYTRRVLHLKDGHTLAVFSYSGSAAADWRFLIAASRLLWGGTDRWGQMHNSPPRQPSACLFAFDPATRKVARTLQPFASADVVNVLGCPREGMVVATDGAQLVAVDTKTLTCAPLRFPTAPPRVIRRGTDGDAYFCAAGRLYRWRVGDNVFTPTAICPRCRLLAEASPGVWLLADATSVYRVRLVKRQSGTDAK